LELKRARHQTTADNNNNNNNNNNAADTAMAVAVDRPPTVNDMPCALGPNGIEIEIYGP